jgi:hypothetical protein
VIPIEYTYRINDQNNPMDFISQQKIEKTIGKNMCEKHPTMDTKIEAKNMFSKGKIFFSGELPSNPCVGGISPHFNP